MLPETDGENIRGIVIDIIGKVVPYPPAILNIAVDVVDKRKEINRHRHGHDVCIEERERRGVESCQTCAIFREKGTRFAEDFSKRDRDAHAKLWPQVDGARCMEKKKASFREGFAVIDDRRVEPHVTDLCFMSWPAYTVVG